MTSRIMQILISNYDIYHGEFDLNIKSKLNNEKENSYFFSCRYYFIYLGH